MSLPRLIDWLLSVPIFFKVLGIGFIVAILFGSLTLLHTSNNLAGNLHQALEQRARSSASWLAAGLEKAVVTGDILAIRQRLAATLAAIHDVRYIVVRDPAGLAIAHTFPLGVPSDLERLAPAAPPETGEIRTFRDAEGMILEARYPILEGHAGTLQMAFSDRSIVKGITTLVNSVFEALAYSITAGTALGLLLTHLLTKPIRHLVQAAHRIGQGDFGARSQVFVSDEIGRLAVAFNQMADSLEAYRREVQEKERARLSLLDRIVQTQEEERRTISRELHDHLGQSLAALQLALQSEARGGASDGPKEDLVRRVRVLGEEVRQLAWGMHPSILDDYGLDSALSRYVQEMSRLSGIEMDYQHTSPPDLPRLPGRIEVTLYRVTQEAMTNVIRHAQAKRVSVVLLRQRPSVTLLVEDDGRGFDAAGLSGDRCLGLTGMKERVSLLGGACTVESGPGKGTTVRLNIPLDQESP